MNSLTEFLFPAPAARRAGAILRWWERRRLFFNAVVGATGLFSVAAVGMIGAMPPHPHPAPGGVPLPAILVFGLSANLCYLLGPAVELGIEKLGRGRILPTGPVLFRMGLTFSMGLAFLPTLVFSFEWVIRVVRTIF
jgi:hypothetical protein